MKCARLLAFTVLAFMLSQTSADAQSARGSLPSTPPAPKTAAPDDALLEIKNDLQSGMRYRLEITDTQQRLRDGVAEYSVTIVTEADLVVTEAVGGVAVVELVFGTPSVRNSDDSLEARLAITSYRIFEGKRILYRTNGSGAVTGLANSHEIGKVFNDVVDRLIRDVGRETNIPMIVESVRAGLDPMRRGPYMESLALELPKLFHFFSGLKLDSRTNYSRSKFMRLRLNGAEVAGTLDYDLAWFDRTKQVAWLRWSQTADRVRTADVVEAYMRDIAGKAGHRLPIRLDMGSVGASEGAVYELDLKTGLPKTIAFARHYEMLGFSSRQSLNIRVIQ